MYQSDSFQIGRNLLIYLRIQNSESFVRCSASVPLPVGWQCSWHGNSSKLGEDFEELARLRRRTGDSELLHSELQSGSLHSKMCCGPLRARPNPVALP